MVDSLFQGPQGGGGTQNSILSSEDYLSNAQRSMNNIEDGFFISPAFLDKLSIHVAKNFLDLPKIKVPLILGIWGGKGQGKTFQVNPQILEPLSPCWKAWKVVIHLPIRTKQINPNCRSQTILKTITFEVFSTDVMITCMDSNLPVSELQQMLTLTL